MLHLGEAVGSASLCYCYSPWMLFRAAPNPLLLLEVVLISHPDISRLAARWVLTSPARDMNETGFWRAGKARPRMQEAVVSADERLDGEIAALR